MDNDKSAGLLNCFFEDACDQIGQKFEAIVSARKVAADRIAELQGCVRDIAFSESTALVVFGSLARREWTRGSDVDWTLLVDGPSSLDHYKIALAIQDRLENQGFVSPGATGTFGGLINSHDLLHHIGGSEDTNLNMTRRLLLLLESYAISGGLTRELVVRRLLDRYIRFGLGVAESTGSALPVPRFLLNDFVRLWRTLAVDYAAKKWLQADKKWALRNAKLRVSRKLIFVKGLLMCFHGALFSEQWPWVDLPNTHTSAEDRLATGVRYLVDVPALDLLCQTVRLLGKENVLHPVLEQYAMFLSLMDDPPSREYLANGVSFDNAGSDPLFARVRNIGRQFGQQLEGLFFDCEPMRDLTRKYGVF